MTSKEFPISPATLQSNYQSLGADISPPEQGGMSIDATPATNGVGGVNPAPRPDSETSPFHTHNGIDSPYLTNLLIGNGTNSYHLDPAQGMWMGADLFASAPFSVDMAGNLVAQQLSIGGVKDITVSSGDNIQTALDSIHAAGGGVVRFSPGTYTITSALTIYSNTTLLGQNSNNTILYFGATSANLTMTGTSVYTTGTIASIGSGVNVVGSGTTWTSAMVGQQIFISNRWYVIAAFTDTTHITLASSYADGATYSGTYRIATPISDVGIRGLTLTGSTGTAIVGTDMRDITYYDLVFASNNKGYSLTNLMSLISEDVTCASNTSNGYEITNASFCNFYSNPAVSNGGSGAVLNNVKTSGWILSAADANTLDGFNLTSVIGCLFNVEISGNGSNGMELVSGCNYNFLNNSIVSGNASDGVKITATSDYNTIGSCVNILGNGGYGINIAAASCDGNIIIFPLYQSNVSGTLSDSGTGTSVK